MQATTKLLLQVNLTDVYFGSDFQLTNNGIKKSKAEVITHLARVITSLPPMEEIEIAGFDIFKIQLINFASNEQTSQLTKIATYIDEHLCTSRLKEVHRVLKENPLLAKSDDLAYLAAILSVLHRNITTISLIKELKEAAEHLQKLKQTYPDITIELEENAPPSFIFSVRQNDNCTAEAISTILKMIRYPVMQTMEKSADDTEYLAYLLHNQKNIDLCVAYNATNALGQLLLNESTHQLREGIQRLNLKIDETQAQGKRHREEYRFFCYHAMKITGPFSFETLTEDLKAADSIVATFEKSKSQQLYTKIFDYLTKVNQVTISAKLNLLTAPKLIQRTLQGRIDTLSSELDLGSKCQKFALTETELRQTITALKESDGTLSDAKKKSPPRDIPGRKIERVPVEETNTLSVNKLTHPFVCDERVLNYFDEEKDPFRGSPKHEANIKLLLKTFTKEDLLFDHNFAWIINWLILPFGIPSVRYNDQSQTGDQQYTLGLEICKKGKPSYNAVATFCFSSKTKYLYHRSLTKKSQGAMVDEMVKQGYYDGEYPPLEFLKEPLQIDRSLTRQTVDDKSFIEKVQGNVIYVQDPKNDALIKVFVTKIF